MCALFFGRLESRKVGDNNVLYLRAGGIISPIFIEQGTVKQTVELIILGGVTVILLGCCSTSIETNDLIGVLMRE